MLPSIIKTAKKDTLHSPERNYSCTLISTSGRLGKWDPLPPINRQPRYMVARRSEIVVTENKTRIQDGNKSDDQHKIRLPHSSFLKKMPVHFHDMHNLATNNWQASGKIRRATKKDLCPRRHIPKSSQNISSKNDLSIGLCGEIQYDTPCYHLPQQTPVSREVPKTIRITSPDPLYHDSPHCSSEESECQESLMYSSPYPGPPPNTRDEDRERPICCGMMA